MTESPLSTMNKAQEFLTDLNESVDEAHMRIDSMQRRQKTVMLVAGAACILGAANAFMTIQAMKAITNLAKGLTQIGQLTVSNNETLAGLSGHDRRTKSSGVANNTHVRISPEQEPQVADSHTVATDSPVAPPAEGPASEPPTWVEEANLDETLSDILREEGGL